MKEIKFRAWEKNKDGQYMYKWREIHKDGSLDDMIDDKDIVLMQYTGVKDRNKHELYEGDIIETKASKSRYVIVCETDRVDFRATNVLDDSVILLNWWDDTKKIGNIYENPELIKKED